MQPTEEISRPAQERDARAPIARGDRPFVMAGSLRHDRSGGEGGPPIEILRFIEREGGL
jgi:hypothetical protein